MSDTAGIILSALMFGTIAFIFWYNAKCHHEWEVIETIKGKTNGWDYIIKVMKCSKCGKIKKVRIL